MPASALGPEHFGSLWEEMERFATCATYRRVFGYWGKQGRELSAKAASAVGVTTPGARSVASEKLVTDVVTDLQMAIWKNLLDAPEGKRIRATRVDAEKWINITVALLAKSAVRKAARDAGWSEAKDASDRERSSTGWVLGGGRSVSPHDIVADREHAERVARIVETLSPKERIVFEAAAEGRPHEDVARELGVEIGSSRSLRSRTLHRVLEKLGETPARDGPGGGNRGTGPPEVSVAA